MKRKATPKPEMIVTDPAIYAPLCPKCGMPIYAQATVSAFLDPADWVAFWGYKDSRWRRCAGQSGGREFIHFRTILNGRFSERLAWIKAAPAPVATQEALL